MASPSDIEMPSANAMINFADKSASRPKGAFSQHYENNRCQICQTLVLRMPTSEACVDVDSIAGGQRADGEPVPVQLGRGRGEDVPRRAAHGG